MPRRRAIPILLPALIAVAIGFGPGAWSPTASADPGVVRFANEPHVQIEHLKANGAASFARGATFSLHAGAKAGGDMDRITALPLLGRPETDTFPTSFAMRGNPLHPVAIANPTSNGKPYSVANKVYDTGRIFTSGVATSIAGVAANETVATAEASVSFASQMVPAAPPIRKQPGIVYESVPIGTRAAVTKDSNNSPGGKAGVLVLDPVTFGPVEAGDLLGGGLALSRSGFTVQLSDPLGQAGLVLEAGSDFPVAHPSPGQTAQLGMSFQGLPLIYSLHMTFEPGQLLNPEIDFASSGDYTFFNPDNGSTLSPGGVEAFVRNRILSHLRLLTPSDPTTVTLDMDFTLFDYEGALDPNLTSLPMSFQVDSLVGGVVESVPEPASLTSASLAIALTLGCAWRRHRRARSSKGYSR